MKLILLQILHEQFENFLSVLAGDSTRGSSNLALTAVLKSRLSEEERKSLVRQIGKLPFEKQLRRIVEFQALDDIIRHIEAFEAFIVRTTDHWMFHCGREKLVHSSLQRIYQLSKEKRMVEVMGYEPLRKIETAEIGAAWAIDPWLAIQKISTFTSDRVLRILKCFPAFFHNPLCKDALDQCLRDPALWSIESVQDLEKTVCSWVSPGEALTKNWVVSRLLGHLEPRSQFLSDLSSMGFLNGWNHYVEKTFSSILKENLDAGASCALEYFWMSPKCLECKFSFE